MKRSDYHFVLLLSVAALLLALVANARAAPPKKLAPPWVCTMANRLEIFVDEDDIMYACECEALSSGHICRWQVIGGVERATLRKHYRHTRARTIPVLVVRMPHA